MKRTKMVLAAFIAALMCVSVLPLGVFAGTVRPSETVSGTCGANLTWTLDTVTGALSITGTGNMEGWPAIYYVPWYDYRDIITSVTMSEGVTGIGSCAFAYCPSLAAVEIPDTVTTLDRWAFYSCGSLLGVSIPDGVTEIGTEAFHSCSSLAELRLGANTRTIKNNAFSFCSSLTTVELPADVTTMESCAFRCCFSMTSAVFKGNPPVSFEDGVFDQCASGFAIVYDPAYASAWAPNGETEWNGYPIASGESMSSGQLGDNLAWDLNSATGMLTITGTGEMTAFSQAPWQASAQDIISITIGQGVTSVANNAFRGLPALTRVSAANTVNSIGASAFRDCPQLTTCVFEGVTTIGEHAFSGCALLSEPGCRYAESIGSYAFSGCASLTGFDLDHVTSLGACAFKDCTSLKFVLVDGGLVHIPESAFENCRELHYAVLDEHVTSIGSRAFAGTALTTVHIPATVSSIASGAFADCPLLTAARFEGAPVASFGSGVFAGAYPKFSVVYEAANASAWASFGSSWQGYTLVGSSSISEGWSDGGAGWSVNRVTGVMNVETDYYQCSFSQRPGFSVPWYNERNFVTDLVVGRDVIGIGYEALVDFTRLNTVTLTDSLTSIGSSAFQGCTSLRGLTLPESLEALGYGAFKGCTSLTTAVIPDSVTDCSGAVFEGCTGITYAKVGCGMTSVPEALFHSCSSLVSVSLPDSITVISIAAFSYCSALASISIPKGVTMLGDYPFSHCNSLTEIVLPASLNNLGSEAFGHCTGLRSIIFEGDPPAQVGYDPFNGCSSSLTLYYYSAHASAWSPNGETVWNGRPIVMLEGPVALPGDVNGDGMVTANDALLVLRFSLGLMGGVGVEGDVDGNGVVTANDALMILRAALGLAEI